MDTIILLKHLIKEIPKIMNTYSANKKVAKSYAYGSVAGSASLVLIVAIVALLITGLIFFMVYSSTYNMANSYENQIQNLQKQSESTLSNYSTQIAEMVQVPNKYKNDLLEVIKATMSGRYGHTGDGNANGNAETNTTPLMQFIHEQNLQLDSKLYLNLQNSMVAGRREFKISQDKLMDACRGYKTELGSFVTGSLLRMQGYPKLNLDDYCNVISDMNTRNTFETKTQQPIKIE